jgi:hypothetical protein
MGVPTPNNIFYKPDIGASGAVEKGLFDDGLDVADGFIEGNKPANNKLSAFAATTSLELAGVISDKIGAGKLRFDTSVTVKTTTANITLDEAGQILVSASSPYTITLPTPVGHLGLRYPVKKIDFNYNLITVATVAGQFNYPNDDSVLKNTYPRLNTGGAEATFISDGSNWQVINEAMGQAPYFRMELADTQLNFTNATWQQVMFDQKGADIGSNIDISVWVSGLTTGTVANHVIDSGGAFTVDMIGRRIKNTTDSTYTYITAWTSATDITVRDDIFVSGEGYELKYSKLVVPIPGKYSVRGSIGTLANTSLAGAAYIGGIRKNGVGLADMRVHSSVDFTVMPALTVMESLLKDDILELWFWNNSGVNTIDIYYGTDQSYLQGILIEKE